MAMAAQIIPISTRDSVCADCPLTGDCLSRDVDHPEHRGAHDLPVSPRIVRRGEHLFRGGEEFGAVYVVRSGTVKTYVILQNGDEQVTGFHGPGEVVGLDAIDGGCFTEHAVALDTSSICVLPYDKLCRLCGHSPTVQRRLSNHMSRTIVRQRSLLLMLGQKSAEQRMAAFLLQQVEKQCRQGYSGTEVNLTMSRADIGSYLALAVETVSRVLTRLQEAGVVEVERNRIRVLDHEALSHAADERSPRPTERMPATASRAAH